MVAFTAANARCLGVSAMPLLAAGDTTAAPLRGMDLEARKMFLESVGGWLGKRLPDKTILAANRDGIGSPSIRALVKGAYDELGIHMVALPEGHLPEDLRGAEGGARDLVALCREVATHDLGFATAVLATFLGLEPILLGATGEQLDRIVPTLAQGAIWAYGVTEPNAGSDFSAIKTTATPTAGGYLINGSKIFISNGTISDGLTILAKTPDGKLSFFWVEIERDADGAVVSPKGLTTNVLKGKMGQHLSDTAEISFDNLFVPAENLVGGAEGLGAEQAGKTFDYTRLMVACFGAAAGVRALGIATAYGKERVQFGGPMTDKQVYTHRLLVPHAARLAAADAYIDEIAWGLDRGETGVAMEGGMIKVLAAEAGSAAIDAAIQAHGGYGYMDEYRVAQIWLDARVLRIYEGATEALLPANGLQVMRGAKKRYGLLSQEMTQLAGENAGVGADNVARAAQTLSDRVQGLVGVANKNLAIRAGFAELAAEVNAAAALARKAAAAARLESGVAAAEARRLEVLSRIFSRSVAEDSIHRFWTLVRQVHDNNLAADLLVGREPGEYAPITVEV